MALVTRSNRLAVVVESSEGTAVLPTSANDYAPEQDGGVSFSRNFNQIDNPELKGSIGASKGIAGIEEPSADISLHMRGSGTEGQGPQVLDELFEAAFGTETIDATEEVCDSGSTTSIVKVTANGSEHPRGSAVLVKNAAGYEIRPVHSVSTNDLTLGFEMGNAAEDGVGVGKCICYSPADTGHQTLSLWHYLGGGGNVEGMAGGRVTSTGIEIAAGELINASFSIEGIQNYWNPIDTSTNKYIDFDDGGGEENVSVEAKVWSNPHELAAAIATAMNAATSDVITCVYSDSLGKFTIASDGGTFSLLWKTGVNGSDNTDLHVDIGYTDTADDTGSTSYAADSAMSWASPQTPSFDSTDPVVAKNHRAYIGDADDATCFEASTISVSMSTPKANIDSICAESGRSGSIINGREVEISMTALLTQHQADYFRRLKDNTDTRFMYAGGEKSGGNWVPGKCYCLYMPSGTITNFETGDADGLITADITMKAYVDSDGNGEFYLNFL